MRWLHLLHLKETIDFDSGKYTEMIKGRDHAHLSILEAVCSL